jgi:putative phosphoesterase
MTDVLVPPSSPPQAKAAFAVTPQSFPAHTVAVLADCHIHSGGGPDFTPAMLAAFEGVDLIVTLGDMGEASGLDRLSQIAPVVGVSGADDSDDPRTAPAARAIAIGDFVLGCVFDPVEAGLATEKAPFVAAADFETRMQAVFGGAVDALLFASTHAPAIDTAGEVLLVNPGSATLPMGAEDGMPGSFARLRFDDALGVDIVLLV